MSEQDDSATFTVMEDGGIDASRFITRATRPASGQCESNVSSVLINPLCLSTSE